VSHRLARYLSGKADIMLYILLAVILIVIDQVVKFLVRAQIPMGGHVPFIPYILELTYAQNTGAAFSILEKHTWLLTLVSSLVVIIMVVILWKKVITHPLGKIPTVMVIAGGIGNLIDRIALGYVTDMFNTLFMNFAVFNVADICITVGGILLVIYVLFFYEKYEKKRSENHAHGADLPPNDS
jgi:signal peptidase II